MDKKILRELAEKAIYLKNNPQRQQVDAVDEAWGINAIYDYRGFFLALHALNAEATPETILLLLDEIEAMRKTLPSEWVSVNTAMPTKSGEYLVYVQGSNGNKFVSIVWHHCCAKKFMEYVTHWQELPAAPEEIRKPA